MPLDRSHLTAAEIEILIDALKYHKHDLGKLDTLGVDELVRRDARWRLFVVESLLHELD